MLWKPSQKRQKEERKKKGTAMKQSWQVSVAILLLVIPLKSQRRQRPIALRCKIANTSRSRMAAKERVSSLWLTSSSADIITGGKADKRPHHLSSFLQRWRCKAYLVKRKRKKTMSGNLIRKVRWSWTDSSTFFTIIKKIPQRALFPFIIVGLTRRIELMN